VIYSAELYVFVTTCFQVFRIYVQSVHSGLDVMRGCHLGGRGSKDLRTFQRFTTLVFPWKSYLWNSVTATKTIRYADL